MSDPPTPSPSPDGGPPGEEGGASEPDRARGCARRIGRYEVLEVLGRGGMGEVYRAHDPVLGRTVAIKQLWHVTEEYLARFHREACTVARLDHPNITRIFDRGDDERGPFFVMEYLDGASLREHIRERSLSLDRALDVARQVCDGLHYAHSSGVEVHRDIKPGNIQVTAAGLVKIMDFGIAKLAEDLQMTRNLTQANTVLGTLHYLAPEQIKGARLDRRADLWALGVVLYELLHGVRPFDHADDDEVMKSILFDEPREVPPLPTSADEAIREVLRRVLEKDPARRHPTAAALAADLDRCLLEAKQARPVAPARPRDARETFEEGKRLRRCGQYARALACFRRVLEAHPDDPGSLANAAICERAYRRERAEELNKIGVLLFKNREYGVCIATFEELLRLAPRHEDARTLITWARRERTREEERLDLSTLVGDVLGSLPEDDEVGAPSPGPGRGSLVPSTPPAEPEAASPPAVPVEVRERSTGRVSAWLRRLFAK